MKRLVAGLMLAALAGPAMAAMKTVTLSVPGMNCATGGAGYPSTLVEEKK